MTVRICTAVTIVALALAFALPLLVRHLTGLDQPPAGVHLTQP